VELDPDALVAAIHAMQADPSIGLLAPDVCGAGGERQYLCKRYPSVWVLFLRGFAPAMLRRAFWRSLERYEMRDVLGSQPCSPVPLASGCFMVVRTAIFRRLGGFDPRFFMYFEDYDLSLRIGPRSEGRIRPAARIVHHGGEAARKGPAPRLLVPAFGVAFLRHARLEDRLGLAPRAIEETFQRAHRFIATEDLVPALGHASRDPLAMLGVAAQCDGFRDIGVPVGDDELG
jgi:GT2 family glycosyltransferase